VSQSTLGGMAKGSQTIFIECRRCGHKGQREVVFLPLPLEARWRCSACQNREPTIKMGIRRRPRRASSFPKGNRRS
jgi:hypothetical protein